MQSPFGVQTPLELIPPSSISSPVTASPGDRTREDRPPKHGPVLEVMRNVEPGLTSCLAGFLEPP